MLNRMRIRTMLLAAFGVLILLMLVIVGVTHLRVSGFATSIGEIQRSIYPTASAAESIRFYVVNNWSNTLTLSTITNKIVMTRIEEEMAANNKAITSNFEFLKRDLQTDEGKKLLEGATAASNTYAENLKEYVAMLSDEDKDPARFFLMGPLKSSLEAYLESTGKIAAAMKSRLEEESIASLKAANQTRAINLGIGVAALLAALVSAALMVKTITSQLGGEVFEAQNIAREISNGNLTINIALRQGDSTSLLASLNVMRDKLRTMAGEIQEEVQRVNDTAHKVAQISAEVAHSTIAQSDAASSAAASVEQLTVSVNHLSSDADDAHRYSHQASEQAQQGDAVIRGAEAEMGQIAESVQASAAVIAELEQHSNEITAIVNVIKEIADQTNLLALNAAIEAARAGEQGRGFAVVADEVRKLAERTSNSTLEIAATIDKIQIGTRAAVQSMVRGVDQVAAGTRMAEAAGDSIGKIQSGASHVLDAINDISMSLKEQSEASNGIARNIEQIALMINENKAASERVAAAAGSMEEVAEALSSSMRFFRL